MNRNRQLHCQRCRLRGHGQGSPMCPLFQQAGEIYVVKYYIVNNGVRVAIFRHHGLVVNGIEYSYGPRGTRINQPGRCYSRNGAQLIGYHQLIHYRTNLDNQQVRDILQALREDHFRGPDYCVLNNNCIHFACQLLQRIFNEEHPYEEFNTPAVLVQYPARSIRRALQFFGLQYADDWQFLQHHAHLPQVRCPLCMLDRVPHQRQ